MFVLKQQRTGGYLADIIDKGEITSNLFCAHRFTYAEALNLLPTLEGKYSIEMDIVHNPKELIQIAVDAYERLEAASRAFQLANNELSLITNCLANKFQTDTNYLVNDNLVRFEVDSKESVKIVIDKVRVLE
jgi:hypothetical protein